MKYQKIQQNIESSAKAPKELKQKTFNKIEQLNIIFELVGFFAHAPKTLLESDKAKKNTNN